MKLESVKTFYFLGIGGIGMSALARFFRALGKDVSGYDKTSTALTDQLKREGIEVCFEESIDQIPAHVRDLNLKDEILVVRTPAVPADHAGLKFFEANGYRIMKRAEVLGLIAANTTTIAIAGTHGKTTTTTLTAHLLRHGAVDCSAFLGGISGNYQTNLLLGSKLGKQDVSMQENIVVAEADEYDRSFLHLHPTVEVITSVDADHLDIYGDRESMLETYRQFTRQVRVGGKLITKISVLNELKIEKTEQILTYSLDNTAADFFASSIEINDGFYCFNLNYPGGTLEGLKLGLPGRHNVENAVAATAAALQVGLSVDAVRSGLETFKGVQRRFEYHIRDSKIVYIDDYGHHPEELRACISSVRELYPQKRITGIFQPHLFSRTRDFADGFVKSLDLLDEVVLLDIYPAREKPIPGVSSSMLLEKIQAKKKVLVTKSDLLQTIDQLHPEVLLTMGAGDIDQFVQPLENQLRKTYNITSTNA